MINEHSSCTRKALGHPSWSQVTHDDPRGSQVVRGSPSSSKVVVGGPSWPYFVLVDVPENSGPHLLSPNIAAAARRHLHWVNPDKVEVDRLLATPVLSAV